MAKTKKRGNGEGSICKRKDGRYCAVVTTGRNANTGKLDRKYVYGKTRPEVAQKLTRVLSEVQKGIFVKTEKLTVGEWLDTWLKEYAKPHIRPLTWELYERIIRLHVKPVIGNIDLKQLQPRHLQTLYNQKHESGRVDKQGGLSARTVQIMHNIIHAGLDQALKEGLLSRNVSEATKLPQRVKKEMRVFSLEEQERFQEILQHNRFKAAFLLLLGTGLRRGELLGLKWQDIDLREGVLRVRQSLLRIQAENESTQTILSFQPLKTVKSLRSIPIPAPVVEALKAHKVMQEKEKEICGPGYDSQELVFCTEDGRPIEPRNFNRKFYELRGKAKISGINLHALRHTYATRLLEINVNPKIVQELLGHSQISMTMDTYSHVMPELKKDAVSKLDNILSRKKGHSEKEKPEE